MWRPYRPASLVVVSAPLEAAPKQPRSRKALRALNDALTEQLGSIGDENEALREQVRRLEADTARLHDSLQRVERSRSELDELRGRLEVRVAEGGQALRSAVEQLAQWREYAANLLRVVEIQREWIAWYKSEVGARDEQVAGLEAEVAELTEALAETEAELETTRTELEAVRSELEAVRSELEEVRTQRQEAAALPAALEAALREQITDLRTRLDHAAELVDHVVRRLVTAHEPPPSEPDRGRLRFPLVTFGGSETAIPIDLDEDVPYLRDRPTA